jgi:hypothetical protein
MRTFVTFGILAALLLAATATTAISLNIKLALALGVPCSNCGASILSPGKETQNSETGGQNAKAFAPGQQAEFPFPTCGGCAKDFAPGQQALKAGIIGPELKK